MINEKLLNDTWKAFLDMYVLANFYNEQPHNTDNTEKLLWILRVLKAHLTDMYKAIEESEDGKRR